MAIKKDCHSTVRKCASFGSDFYRSFDGRTLYSVFIYNRSFDYSSLLFEPEFHISFKSVSHIYADGFASASAAPLPAEAFCGFHSHKGINLAFFLIKYNEPKGVIIDIFPDFLGVSFKYFPKVVSEKSSGGSLS